MLRHVQRWPVPGTGHCLESLLYRMATLCDLPMRPGKTLSLTITLPNEKCIEVSQAVVRWSRGQEFAVETVSIERHTHARLQHYVKRLVQEPTESLS